MNPDAQVQRLNAAIVKVVGTPDMAQSLAKQGLEPQTGTPEQFAALIRAELAQNAKLVKAIDLKPE